MSQTTCSDCESINNDPWQKDDCNKCNVFYNREDLSQGFCEACHDCDTCGATNTMEFIKEDKDDEDEEWEWKCRRCYDSDKKVEEDDIPLQTADGHDVKCWWCNSRYPDTKKMVDGEAIYYHADCA